jgi:hypothetical protein
MKSSVFVLLLISMVGCASKSVKVLDAPWTSMKHNGPPANPKTLARVGDIEERYCMESWSGSYGLMDEAVKQAEAKRNIDYIRNASFVRELGRPCVTVVGEGYRSNP